MTAIPLLAHRAPGDVLAWRAAGPLTVAAFLRDVRALAPRLPSAGYVMNLCNDRYRFSVGLAATLCRGSVSLLPPGAAPEVLRRLAHEYPGSCPLTDPGTVVPGVSDAVEVVAGEANTRPGADRDIEIPSFAPGQLAVIAFTSGSTGAPVAQPKSWGSIALGATEEAAALGIDARSGATLVGTVPPQHMYGFESTVVLALRAGLTLHAARPLYPADVADALGQVPAPRVLVTTPVHLRALLMEGIALPPLELIVSATAPLPVPMAREAETRYATRLLEIYGFTEAGMVATRRTAQEGAWHTLPGICVRGEGDLGYFSQGHVQREVAATDVIEVLDRTTFRLHGRSADLVNVAGRHTSLAALNHELTSIDGVEDGVFFMPEGDAAQVTRPTAFVVAPRLTRDALLAALRERIDPVFMPRPLHLVDALPRNATGKLPREALIELAARLAAPAARPVSPARTVVRLLDPEHAVARGHFPGNPVLPGAVLLDAVLRAAEDLLGTRASAWEITAAKFPSPARPGDAVAIALTPAKGQALAFECQVDQRTVASGTLKRLAEGEAGATRERGQ